MDESSGFYPEGSEFESRAGHMAKEKLFSVTLDDCEIQTFRAGGNGGQNQNKRDTGVRIIHHPSGARAESREERSQLQNKKAAFLKMVRTPKFKIWINQMIFQRESPELQVEKDMLPKNLLVEVYSKEGWVPEWTSSG